MSKPALVLAAAAVTLDPTSVPDGGRSWIQLLPAGRATMRDGRIADVGGIERMREIVAATVKRAGSNDVVVDYDHQSVFAAVPNVGGRAPAAGWIKTFDARPDGIWGEVEWTAAATAAIRAGEYRYVSPVFFADAATGAVRVVVNAGLTNNPAFDLAEVRAASARFLPPEQDPDMKGIAKALGLAEDATEDQIVAAVSARDATLTAIAAAAQTQATGDGLVAVVAGAVQRAAAPDPTKFVPVELLTTANARIAELTAGAVAD